MKAFKIAREMRELLVTKIVADGLDSLTLLETGIGEAQAHFPKAHPDGASVMFDEMALEGAQGDTASAREQPGSKTRRKCERFPGDLLPGRIGKGRLDRSSRRVVNNDGRGTKRPSRPRIIYHHKFPFPERERRAVTYLAVDGVKSVFLADRGG